MTRMKLSERAQWEHMKSVLMHSERSFQELLNIALRLKDDGISVQLQGLLWSINWLIIKVKEKMKERGL